MGKFSEYPAATANDYANASTFLIQNDDGTTKLATFEGLAQTFFCSVYCAEVTIPSAEVLTLNSTPVEVIPAQGVGTVIDIISWVGKISGVGTPYATNTVFTLTNGGGNNLGQSSSLLTSTVDKIGQFARGENPASGNTQMIENTAVTATVQTGNPTAGDGDITVYVLYRIINV